MLRALRRGLAAFVLVLVAACGGGGGEGGSPEASPNTAPTASLLATGDAQRNGATVEVPLGGAVRLDASQSVDPDRDTLSYVWRLVSAPSGSNSWIAATREGPHLAIRPDRLGEYRIEVTVVDPRGAYSLQQIRFVATDATPTNQVRLVAQLSAASTTPPVQPVTQGGTVVVDATASADPDGDALTITFALVERPTGSTAALVVNGNIARLAVDQLGTYRVRVRGLDGKGGSFETVYTLQADNRVPNPVVAVAVNPVVASGGASTAQASVGYDVVLGSAGSSDADGDTLTREWLLVSRPAGSAAQLSAATGVSTGFSPDTLGNYVVQLTVADPRGAKSVHTTTVQVNNRRPTASLATNATPQALAPAPAVHVPLGTELTLNGGASHDEDGDALVYAWSVDSRPAGSTAALSSTTAVRPLFIADREGVYLVRLRVTDTAGAFSERTLTLNVGTHAPVALVDRDRVSVLVGAPVSASAALSYDEDGEALSYEWRLDARPAGSAAALSGTTAAMAFTPDVAGVYIATVTVRAGNAAGLASVTVRAMPQIASSVSLTFAPDDVRFSRGLDRVVAVATNPNAVHVVDPYAGGVVSVPLPVAVKNFSLSPDGKLAAVLHEGLVSLVDLEHAALLRTSATMGAQTDVFVTNAGMLYLIGQTGGQWVHEGVVVIDGRTGVEVPQTFKPLFYGTQYGIYADRLNKVFLMEMGLSPADIHYFTIDPATSTVKASGDSPYHGDYSMYVPLYLTDNQDLLFTRYGNYFRTDTLRYAGRLAGVNTIDSFSHSTPLGEALVLEPPVSNALPSHYKRYTGALFLPDADLPVPTVNGAPAYGLKVFHGAAGRHVLLVQTGTAVPKGTGVAYHVVTR